MKIDRNTLGATVEDTDVAIFETDCGLPEQDVQVYRDKDGRYHVLRNGVARHPDSSAEDVMRALGVYIQSALYKSPKPEQRCMRAPADRDNLKGEAIAQRMMSICGCVGQYDCDCVTVYNQAVGELSGEFNIRNRFGKGTSA
jgi:hypothetical protein